MSPAKPAMFDDHSHVEGKMKKKKHESKIKEAV
jgi:hypothetical protein